MASKTSSSKPKFFIFFILFLSFSLFFIVLSFRPKPNLVNTRGLQHQAKISNGFNLIAKEFKGKKVKVGLVNVGDKIEATYRFLGLSKSNIEAVKVGFDRVSKNLTWNNFFPEWIDEDEKWAPPKCPETPLPRVEDYKDLDVVIARVPLVANLVVRNGWISSPDVNRTVYTVFIGSCEPMVEIFRCDDLVMHQGDHWVYKPELRGLKQKVLMPFGSCQLAPSYAQTGDEAWRNHWSQFQKEAYVTVLHSSQAYVCGAIALAQSIIQSKSNKDLVLLADDSISSKSIQGLTAAGWKIKRIRRIQSPFAKKDSYNEWNYSKLRIWQLIEYDKVIFMDADLLVLKNIDKFFILPQLSAAPNSRMIFNSGVMPWMCYKDYDCNWDMWNHHPFASDSAHKWWWHVFDAMPKNLQPYCGLTKEMDARIRKWRGKARRASFPDGHWRIKVEDPRQHHFVN
ncbi:hypothetical protein SO802_013477 [Lithocarpus litseifolius]|uniref:Hexosyltransferase n=1 Tax=Lithocarpus litseifolius TaxID=425828 RepID=A0AAW2DB75_9ROSI